MEQLQVKKDLKQENKSLLNFKFNVATINKLKPVNLEKFDGFLLYFLFISACWYFAC